MIQGEKVTISPGYEVDMINEWQPQHQQIMCNSTHWLHTPKTGSTFCLTLQHVCCPTRFQHLVEGIDFKILEEAMKKPSHERPFTYRSSFCYKFIRHDKIERNILRCQIGGPVEHVPMRWKADEQRIIMVRNPRTRIVSAFLDAMHHEGMKNDLWMQWEQELKRFHTNTYEQWLQKAQVYANIPGMKGCQTKMILGHGCASNITLPSNYAIKLEQRLRRFFFVGIFEQFQQSQQLFHQLANINTTATVVEMFPQRVQKRTDLQQYLNDHLEFHDPYDETLYEIAMKIFKEQNQYILKIKNIR